ADVTQKTSIRSTEVQPSTTYTLQVWAFAAMDGDYSTPPAVTLTATTADLQQLAAPVVSASSENGVTFSWNAVENANEYSYSIADASGATVKTGTTTDNSVSLSGYPNGDYTITVIALGHDGFSNSEPATATGTILVFELYRVEGTYHSAQLDSDWTATMVAYSDNSYSILAFYGVEGYNLDFAVDSSNTDDMFSFLNGEYVYDDAMSYTTWQIPTGLTDPAMLIAYPWNNYSYLDGDRQKGSVNIGCYHGEGYANWDYDTFSWPAAPDDDPMAAITGTFTNHFVGTSSINDDWEWEDIDASDWKATIKKVDDKTVEIDGLYWTECPVYGIVDFEAGTITIEAQEYGDTYYTFASTAGATESVVATINADGSITVPDICLWYYFDGDGWYHYMYGTSILTK
ncbi:MAG: fibronectin type III domain-containing protein, partial [Muribaculaceae bacterium]|nr:fibronectin type III domain-containing protein [Muribaculaceae bacterium]